MSISQTGLHEADPDIAAAIDREAQRQEDNLELIPSENAVSRAVLEAQGSVLTNKYAEGLPGKRYYGGCEYVDVVEQIAIDRAIELFGADFANVQPHSGSQANMAVYVSQLEPGDTILAMNLTHGGHLTHGSPVNFSGKFFNVVPYGVREEDQRNAFDQQCDEQPLDASPEAAALHELVAYKTAERPGEDVHQAEKSGDETGRLDPETEVIHVVQGRDVVDRQLDSETRCVDHEQGPNAIVLRGGHERALGLRDGGQFALGP